jgi:tryptophan synthase beta subunit
MKEVKSNAEATTKGAYAPADFPDAAGHYGAYGGRYVAETLMPALLELESAYASISNDPDFQHQLRELLNQYAGRPTPLYYAKRLSRHFPHVQIYLKREDLLHTGAHKVNNTLGQALLAKHMGKEKLIAETGAGQHGVATATVAALLGMQCSVFMGREDVFRQAPNVRRMELLGARVITVDSGAGTLKDAMNEAMRYWVGAVEDTFYVIGSVAGPHPYPMMVRDFQRVIGVESRQQIMETLGRLPDLLIACVGGGSNAMGLFSAFLNDSCEIWGVEPLGRGPGVGDHAATMTYGMPGIIHGFKCYLLQDEKGEPSPVYSIASGLDYPGVGPEHSYLKDQGRINYTTADDKESLDAFFTLSRQEGIIPALESAHAVAFAMKKAREMRRGSILVNLSGRGDKDLDFVTENYGFGG